MGFMIEDVLILNVCLPIREYKKEVAWCDSWLLCYKTIWDNDHCICVSIVIVLQFYRLDEIIENNKKLHVRIELVLMYKHATLTVTWLLSYFKSNY